MSRRNDLFGLSQVVGVDLVRPSDPHSYSDLLSHLVGDETHGGRRRLRPTTEPTCDIRCRPASRSHSAVASPSFLECRRPFSCLLTGDSLSCSFDFFL